MNNNTVPKVSVVLATYNRRHLLPDTVLSVLNQTFKDFEFIIIDDGSTDDTKSLIEGYQDPRIRFIYTQNQGRSKARNYALSLVKGEYIAFIDSDDLFLPTKLQKQVEFLDSNPDFGMIYTACDVIDDVGKKIPVVYEANVSGDIYYDVAFYLPVTVCLPTVIVRKSVLDKAGHFDETMVRFEDTDIWRRVSKITKIKAFPEILTTIRTHSDNQMEDPDILFTRMDYWIQKVLREDTQFDRKRQNDLAARAWFHYAYAVYHNLKYQNHTIKFIKAALKLSPSNKGYWKWYLKALIPPGRRPKFVKQVGKYLKRVVS